VLCIGQYDGSAYLSLRTEATDARAGSVMRQVVGADMGIKAAGGIRTQDDAKKMIEAGATRLGTSASIKIVRGEKVEGGY